MLKLKLQCFGHLMWRTNSFEKIPMLGKIEGRRKSGWQMMRWLNGIPDSMDMILIKLQDSGAIGDRLKSCCAAVYGFSKCWTWLNDWTEQNQSLERNLYNWVCILDTTRLPRWYRWLRTCLPVLETKTHGFHPCIWKIPWRRAWQPTPVFLPG